jgi:segregation and condensation protein A
MERIAFRIEAFEGPLDLLLAMIGKNKNNICDINIAEILEQYMAYLERMREMDLEIASEFLLMASHLVYIKSKMLLPGEDGEEEDPRQRLIEALEEYKRFKEIASLLAGKAASGADLFVKSPDSPTESGEPVKETYEPEELHEAFMRILVKNRRRLPPPVTAFSGIVSREIVPVAEKLAQIFDRLLVKRVLKLSTLFSEARSRSGIIAVFLAVLTLSKDKKAIIEEEGPGKENSYVLKMADKETVTD